MPGRILGKCNVSRWSHRVQSKKLERKLGHTGGVTSPQRRRSAKCDIFTFGPKMACFWGVAAAARVVCWPENRVLGAFKPNIFDVLQGEKNQEPQGTRILEMPSMYFFFHYFSRKPPIWPRPSGFPWYFSQLNTLKNTIVRTLAGLGGRRGVMVAKLVFQLCISDP